MYTPIQKKVLEVSRAIYHNYSGTKHFTFITLRNQILSIGVNSKKTDPFSFKQKYFWPTTHSELSAIKKFRGDKSIFKRTRIYNVRLNSLGIIGYAKPCQFCQPWLLAIGFNKIFFTDFYGIFQLFIPTDF